MSQFRVIWTIDIEAASPREAARQALAIQRNPNSIATVFQVDPGGDGHTVEIDLEEQTPEQLRHC